jgi:hypothetical protein
MATPKAPWALSQQVVLTELPEHRNSGKLTGSTMPFDYEIDFQNTDFRQHPELYRIGKGEQGVLSVEPYKSEILPHWRFKTVTEAETSAAKIYSLFLAYRDAADFVGMDMARKFLQMGYTRARRYANHPSGRKYAPAAKAGTGSSVEPAPREVLPQAADWATNEKAQAAQVFYRVYTQVKADPDYRKQAQEHILLYGK